MGRRKHQAAVIDIPRFLRRLDSERRVEKPMASVDAPTIDRNRF
jgi:hypothetical protein